MLLLPSSAASVSPQRPPWAFLGLHSSFALYAESLQLADLSALLRQTTTRTEPETCWPSSASVSLREDVSTTEADATAELSQPSALLTNPFLRTDEVESMKKYSEIIESLKISGASGVSGKQSDLSTAVRKTVVIKGDPAHKSLPLQPLASPPRLDDVILTGGLTQSFFE